MPTFNAQGQYVDANGNVIANPGGPDSTIKSGTTPMGPNPFGNATTQYSTAGGYTAAPTNNNTPDPSGPIYTPQSPGFGGTAAPITVNKKIQPALGAPPPTDPLDIGSAGAGEKAFEDVGGKLLDPSALSKFLSGGAGGLSGPGAGDQYWNTVRGSINAPGSTQQVFNELHGQMPQIAATPGLDPYYSNAAKNLSEDVNRQYASRGLFGSTAALQGVGRGLTDLRAQQAKQEADYNLARLAEQRGWNTLLGNEANAADQNRLTALGIGGTMATTTQGLDQQRAAVLGNLLDASGHLDLQKLQAYLQGGQNAEVLKNNRVGQLFNSTFQPAALASGEVGAAGNAEITSDQQMLDAIIAAALGKTTDAANFAAGQKGAVIGDLSNIMNLLQSGKNLGAPTPAAA